ncbi:hypothetical protein GUJ93_ZPchr0004g39241 [Zizania palustris]|uniref:AAR2 N-terminal domain-containing protein n=1 Tax=Zizania palustris TaxID=103762 RepID=A0A8J5SHZ1_ZIZPA|nr:hypothetical protein GUJ93_ZPchr0004g39241 [Zizania palustris]
MDPEVAAELVRKGATLLLLDVPQRTLLGVDTQVFSVGPKFKGIKMVPPGPHSSTTAPPTGTGMSLHLL